jgi:light-regulated signal transduction histidine kinase (bacteriophytochrome)
MDPTPFLYFGLSSLAGLVITFRVLTENDKYSNLSISQELLLKEKNEALEMFSRIAAHDLKSPVRNVLNFSNLMEKNLENQNYAELRKNLDFVLVNCLQMSELIEDMRDFSSIDNPSNNNRERLSLAAVVRKVELLLKTEIEEMNGKIKCNELPDYKCNSSDMLLVFQNIIQNGLKYNRSENPTVEISYKKKEESLYIYFKDNGIGIKEEYFSYIFSLFKRLHSRNEFDGTGLGLSLSKKILQKYKGEISVESVLNEGSTFIIKLPF